ncbi:MAG: FecCD family ABC transporter permease [Actinopolymorphaceae bacterium]
MSHASASTGVGTAQAGSAQARTGQPGAPEPERRRGLLRGGGRRAAGLLALFVLLAFVCLLSLRLGSAELSTSAAVRAFTDFDGSDPHVIVRTLRLPRTVIGLGVGAALGVAGGIMQALTRNPLADPGVLGINAGAAFAIVTAVTVLGVVSPSMYVWFAFAGALGAACVVFAVGSAGRSGTTPVKLALAGVVVSALLGSWTSALLVLDQQTLDEVRFWLAGSLAGRDFGIFWEVSPFLLGGVLLGVLTTRQLNALSLGEDVARALGQRTRLVRAGCVALVVILAGSAVAAAGPIGFVGLAVPHIARVLTGPDYRWILPYSAVLGATLLIAADVAGRIIARPGEIQVGIVTALVGAPFLVVLARRRKLAEV